MRYPGSESENLNYYDQFNKENIQNKETLKPNYIKGGFFELKLGKHFYKYTLIKVESIKKLPDEIYNKFKNPANLNGIRLYFYNKKIYQGYFYDLLYKKESHKLTFVGYIHQGNIEKLEKPKILYLDEKHKIANYIIRQLNCSNCKYMISGNTITIFQESIQEKIKRYDEGKFNFELRYNKKRHIKSLLIIVLGDNNGLIKKPNGQIIARMEKYLVERLILNLQGKVLGQISSSSIISFKVDNGIIKLKIDSTNF